MVNLFPFSMKRQRYPTVSVSASILVINLTNTLFNVRILVRLAESFSMVIKRTARYLRSPEKLIKRIKLP